MNLIEQEKLWYPLSFLGIKHQLSGVNQGTVINTWITLLILFILLKIAAYYLKKENSIAQFIIKKTASSFITLIEQSTGKFIPRYYYFITGLFIFIISCNWISLIPHVEEPTKDLNTTLALGIIAFLYAQKEVIKAHGFLAYLKDFFIPFDIIFPLNIITGLAMLPLKLLAELASIISISFRLFGNIFGGFIIGSIYHKAISGSIILNLLGLPVTLVITSFFILFEGFLQAFVFAILTLTNIAMAVRTENEEYTQ